ncbi:purine-nucleoside phosphorylase [Allofustis seminis]|uniref:purine-nucleoside phosphorylase n=1 Tax=Allofustis seminis TaxID=166939 RepID=UPI000368BA40|nr:purine-nucleoside phosphorylase [Allofustis seminis]
MSTHIGASKGDIAKIVLLPGDPLRAKYIAETFLEDVRQYNTVRNAFGYTGTYQGVPISVQGTGMGVPSISIYVEELIRDFDCEVLIRVGSAGALKEDVKVRDVILAQGATTDSGMNRQIFHQQVDYAPLADFSLLKAAYETGKKAGYNVHVGNILTADRFYNEELDKVKLAEYGILGVEMEAAALYTIAAKHNRKALAVCTVSDHIITGEQTSAEERETTFNDMIKIALEAAIHHEN